MADRQFVVEFEYLYKGNIKITASDEVEALAIVDEMGKDKSTRNLLYQKLVQSPKICARAVKSLNGTVFAARAQQETLPFEKEEKQYDYSDSYYQKGGKRCKKGKKGRRGKPSPA